MRRTGWKKTQDLSDKMDWQHIGEPSVMTWTVKAIDRSILAWTCVFGGPIGIFLLLSIYFLFSGETLLAACLTFPTVLLMFLFVKIGMEKTIFVYRATNERLELCHWQDIPDLVFTFLKAFPFIIVGIILMSFISNPALSIAALVGPALIGIVIASVGSDSNYKAIYKKFGTHEFKWSDISQALLDDNKKMLALSVEGPNKAVPNEEINLNNPDDHLYLYPIYFHKDQQAHVVRLFREKMSSNVTMIEGSYKFPFSG